MRQFPANVRQKEQFVVVKGMSETSSCTRSKDEILHLDLTLGIIRYLFYFVHQADCGNKGKGGGVVDLSEAEGQSEKIRRSVLSIDSAIRMLKISAN